LRLLIIIPAYNEQASLAALLDEIRALGDIGATVETVVVDDGSTDRTADVAEAGGARVLRLCRNLGIGGAVQSGLRLAYREHFDAAVQCDGDGQHPPGEIKSLLAIQGDLVVGTRFANKTTFRSTALRRMGSWWLRVVLRVLTRLRVTDPTSGFRLYRARALQLFDSVYPYDFPEPESLAIARAAHLTIAEAPVTMRERQGGRSSIGSFSAVYYMFKVTIAVMLTYIRALGRKPEEADEPNR
jgi:glycosyltransferase involved in cell wall biosynthesis